MGKGNPKKEYRLLPETGLTVLGMAVSAFAAIPEIQAIAITVPDDPETGEAAARQALPPELLEENACPRVYFVPGGPTRRASVFNALSLLSFELEPSLPRYVLIHDGARPWASDSLIRRVIAEVKINRAAIPLLPLTDTPKETDIPLEGSGGKAVFIKRNLKRALTGTAQTPQGFVFQEILGAHEKAALQDGSIEYTDDAEVWAAFCGPVAVVPGELQNKKITFPEDLVC